MSNKEGRTLYEIFPEQRELLEVAKAALRIYLTQPSLGNAAISRVFETTPGSEKFLTSKVAEFGQKPLMQILRAQVVDEIKREKAKQESAPIQIDSHPSGRRQIITGAVKSQDRRTVISRKPVRTESRNVLSIHNPKDIDRISSSLTFIHLSSQSMITVGNLKKLLDHCPNLQMVEFMPTFDVKIGKQVRDLLQERGIQYRFGRIVETAFYDVGPKPKSYRREQENFQKLSEDPSLSFYYSLARKFERLEIQVAQLYYGSGWTSTRKISKKLGISHPQIQKKLNSFQAAFNIGSDRPSVNSESLLIERILLLQRVTESKDKLEELRNSYEINGLKPPTSLPVSRWETWNLVTKATEAEPELLLRLLSSDTRKFTALVAFYQLDTSQIGKITLDQVALSLGYTRERIRQLKNEALEFLGIEEL